MALSRNARTLLQRLVQKTKQLLIDDINSQLSQFYGIESQTGQVHLIENLATQDASILYTAKLLRERLDYINTGQASSKAPLKESIAQLVREQAFTVLNRLAALRMAEERNIIRESIRKKYGSEGFEVYDQVTGQGQTTNVFIRYKWYLHSIFDELAQDLPAVFDRFSPYALMFPQENTLNEILDLINNPDLVNFREEGVPVKNLWKEDETIGWIYQYYNSREEIRAMRDASQAPRNSRELAVRNQFFTPRYVVQFLTDNSLGRIWFEMTRGNTALKEKCEYMIIRPNEVFLQKGEDKPQNNQEDIHYIDKRPIKDPRELLMLDPACGSMHFGLYCFDLFEVIYREAWDNQPELLTDLRNSMSRTEYIRQIPELIIRHNIHGVDIDPRALQIAALSLWLRAQRSFDQLQIAPEQRPAITKSNLVLAEPMPGNTELLNKVLEPLEKPIQELVRHIWDAMNLAGETGLLLRIEKEIDDKIAAIAKELSKETVKQTQLTTDSTADKQKAAKDAARYASKEYRQEFLQNAKTQVLEVLQQLAHQAHNGDSYQRLLFADDSVRGFVFIELCSKSFDVVLMNPPFGLGLRKNYKWMETNYPDAYVDLLAAFIQRGFELSNSHVGAISSRSILLTPKLERVRKNLLISHTTVLLDLGSPVMDDAMVQSAAYVLSKNTHKDVLAIDVKKFAEKANQLNQIQLFFADENKYVVERNIFRYSPRHKLLYNLPLSIFNLFIVKKKFVDSNVLAKQGMKSFDDTRFVRLRHEVLPISINKKWFSYSKGGEFGLFYSDLPVLIKYSENGREIQELNRIKNGTTSQAKQSSIFYYTAGSTYSYRCKDFGLRIMPKSFVIGSKGPKIFCESKELSIYSIIGLLNSTFYNFLINIQANANQYDTGIIDSLPFIDLSEDEIKKIETNVLMAINSLRLFDSYKEETSVFLSIPYGNTITSINKSLQNQLNEAKTAVENALNEVDKIIDSKLNLKSSELLSILSDFDDEEGKIDAKTNTQKANSLFGAISDEDIAKRLISFVFGILIGRWKKPSQSNQDFFNDLDVNKNFTGCIPAQDDSQSKDCLFSFFNEQINYDFENSFKGLIFDLFNSETTSNSLFELLRIKSFSEYFESGNGFFDFHQNLYTSNRRMAPIYWPLSTSTGSFTVWVYYPKLNNQTLYSIISNHINPKEEILDADINKLRNNPNLDNKGIKELRDMENLLHELKDFREGLLQVAQLPYKPNHDDGVLITAAPLYKFFRHTRWRNSTEECWKKLQEGEYDWSHMAYNIWLDRVRKKCVKDLSMAIAHGLEDICEIKPKEPKPKKKKEPKKVKGSHTINFEE